MVGQLAEQAKGESQQAAGQAASGIGSSTKGPEIGAKEGSADLEPGDFGEKKGGGGSGSSDVSGSK